MLELLRSQIERAAGGEPAVVVLVGAAGMGKTWLCERIAEMAADAGFSVQTARGYQGEDRFAHALMADLLRAHDLDAAPSWQAAVLRTLSRLDGPPVPVEPTEAASSCLALLSAAAQDRPVAWVIDDAQWSDPESIANLRFIAGRLRVDRVLLVFATRDAAVPDLSGRAHRRLAVPALTAAETAEILRSDRRVALGATVAQQLAEATGGNVLAVREAARSLSVGHLRGVVPLPEVVTAPASIEAEYARRLAGLEEGTRRALLAMAVDEAAAPIVDEVFETVGVSHEDLEGAERAGLVRLGAPGPRFLHPLVRSAVYQLADPAERRAAHRAVGDAWRRRGDDDAWARHVAAAATSADGEVATVLAESAQRARARGSHREAGATFARAAELEPDPIRRVHLLIEAATDLAAIGSPDALAMLDAASQQSDGGELGAEVAMLHSIALLLAGDLEAADEVATRAAAAVKDTQPERAVELLCQSAYLRATLGSVGRAIEHADEILRLSAVGGAQLRVTALAGAGPILLLAGDFERGNRLCRELLTHPQLDGRNLVLATHCGWWLEEYDLTDELIARALDHQSTGGFSDVPTLLSVRAEVLKLSGRLLEGLAVGQHAYELAEALGQVPPMLFSLLAVAGCQAHVRGIDDELLATFQQWESRNPTSAGTLALLRKLFLASAVGVGCLARSDPLGSIEPLRAAEAFATRYAVEEPHVVRWGADLVEALIRTGSADAEAAQVRFEGVARRSGRRWALAAAARTRALTVRRADRDLAFARALDLHRHVRSPLERARTELCWGRRALEDGDGEVAQHHLRTAVTTFDHVGAANWADQAAALLEQASASTVQRSRPPLLDLTAQEAVVARTVGEGVTNRQAAARLFVSEKTVEFHLSRIYRKLGVRSRAQLIRLLHDAGAEG